MQVKQVLYTVNKTFFSIIQTISADFPAMLRDKGVSMPRLVFQLVDLQQHPLLSKEVNDRRGSKKINDVIEIKLQNTPYKSNVKNSILYLPIH